MKKLLLTGLVFATMSSAALAAEPLTEDRLDAVTAGLSVQGPFLVVKIAGSLDSTKGLVSTFETQTFFVAGL